MFRTTLVLLILGSTSSAFAQRTAVREEIDANYVFEEDPLTALSERERGPLIRTRPHGGRSTLLRPRLHFVAELKKSVENL